MLRLSDGEKIMTLAFFVLIQYRSVTDGQTDIPSLAIPAVCIARYVNALVIMYSLCCLDFFKRCVCKISVVHIDNLLVQLHIL